MTKSLEIILKLGGAKKGESFTYCVTYSVDISIGDGGKTLKYFLTICFYFNQNKPTFLQIPCP